MEEKVQQLQLQQEITNYKDEIKDLQEKLETLKVSIKMPSQSL
jgi:archaellum component FlaC